MKYLLMLSILVGSIPYMFLATNVKHVANSNKEYKCIVSKSVPYESIISFGSVYYSTGNMQDDQRIILPYFFSKGEMFYALCGDKTLSIGMASFIKEGEKIHVYTKMNIVSIFGKELFREESINGFGTGW